MRNLWWIAFLMIFVACDEEMSVDSMTGKWKLTHYYNLKTGMLASEPAGLTNSIILTFSDDGKMGTIEGHTIANAVTGSYELGPHNKITALSFGGTKVGEPQWGSLVWQGMNQATSYKNSQHTMSIFFNEDNEVFLFTRE